MTTRILPLFILWLVLTLPVSAGDDAFPNVVGESTLPSGAGLAAAYDGDVGISGQADVLFADRFDRKDGEAIGGEWDETRNDKQAVLSLDDEGADGSKCLKVTASLGKNTGGGMTKWFHSADTVFVRFYTKFDPECDYVHHFCTLRANCGLQGADKWSGFGGAGEVPDGARRFSTALEPWGNWARWSPPGRWNFYSYWHGMKVSPDGKYWGNSFLPEGQPEIKRGEWICAEFMLKHNTPGKADGEQAYWIDGQLRGHWRGIEWRTDEKLQANALTLESYITDRWTKHPENVVWFDNVVIARSYIGPIGRQGSR
ncbi:MAG: hypothetical protein R3F19_03525 [Verrucomicrobiales bacterium]